MAHIACTGDFGGERIVIRSFVGQVAKRRMPALLVQYRYSTGCIPTAIGWSLTVMVDAKNDPNCAEPACASKVDMFRSFMGPKGGSNSNNSKAGATASTTATASKAPVQQAPDDCPLDREELGRATWGLVRKALLS